MSTEPLSINQAGNDGAVGPFKGTAGPFESGPRSCASFGSVFHFVVPDTDEIVCTFKIEPKVYVYYFDPFVVNNPTDLSAGVHFRPGSA